MKEVAGAVDWTETADVELAVKKTREVQAEINMIGRMVDGEHWMPQSWKKKMVNLFAWRLSKILAVQQSIVVVRGDELSRNCPKSKVWMQRLVQTICQLALSESTTTP